MSSTRGTPAVRLRAARGVDVPTLAALDEQLFGEAAWGETSWWAELARRPRRYYVVAESTREAPRGGAPTGGVPSLDEPAQEPAAPAPERIVGYAGCDLGGSSADVMTVATLPQVRGQGVGDLLMERLARAAQLSGASALLLEVRADNAAALSLYARQGFEEIARRRRYYQPDDVDALVMRKHLETHDVTPVRAALGGAASHTAFHTASPTGGGSWAGEAP